MIRRSFLASLGLLLANPIAIGQERRRMVGFLSSVAEAQARDLVIAFLQGLEEAGFAPEKDVHVEYRWADGQYGKLPALASELVEQGVEVLLASGGGPSGLAAKGATSKVPIVFIGTDPVKVGLVESYGRPGGNITAIDLFSTTVGPKRIELLRELLPKARQLGLLFNPINPNADGQRRETRNAAERLSLTLNEFGASTFEGLASAFAQLRARGIDALIVGADPYLFSERERVIILAAEHRMPAVYQWQEFVESGGLMSYGADIGDVYRQAAHYAARILRGESPSQLPVLQPTKFEFAVNLRTAKTLGLIIPSSMLAQADHIIE